MSVLKEEVILKKKASDKAVSLIESGRLFHMAAIAQMNKCPP